MRDMLSQSCMNVLSLHHGGSGGIEEPQEEKKNTDIWSLMEIYN